MGYATFLRAMGHTVRESGGFYWYNVYPHVYISFPFHRVVEPSSAVLKEVLGNDGWFVRFPTRKEMGFPSFRFVCDNRDYDMESLTSKARNQTRRGLEQCEVRPVSFDELQDSGLRLDEETLHRQGRTFTKEDLSYRQRYYHHAAQAEGAEAWGAFVQGNLAAYLISFRMEGCANILIVRSSLDYLKYYPNNALFFSYIRYVLQQPGIEEVSTGLESLQKGMETLNHFKLGMGFRQVPVGQRIESTGWLKPILSKPIINVLKRLARSRPSDERFTKLAGMLEWYDLQPKLD